MLLTVGFDASASGFLLEDSGKKNVFGAFLIYSGSKLFFEQEKDVHPEQNPIVKLFRRIMPVTSDYEGEYKSTHDDISTLGEPEKEPTLKQAEEIREKNLEAEVKPKIVPEPDLDLTKPEDKALMNTIENGEKL